MKPGLTTWFRASVVAAFSLALWGLYRLRLYQVAREFSAQIGERTRIARDLHDTLLQSFHGLLPRFQAAHNLLPGRVVDAMQVLEVAIDDADGFEALETLGQLRTSKPAQANEPNFLPFRAQFTNHDLDPRRECAHAQQHRYAEEAVSAGRLVSRDQVEIAVPV